MTNEREQWERREKKRQDLIDAAHFLRAMSDATRVLTKYQGPNIYAAMAEAADEALRWLGTVHGGAEPVGSRFATPAEQKKYGATHVLYQRVPGMEPAEPS